jgi:bacteriocin biosynthesis cyclodehydratase domain-containing protein
MQLDLTPERLRALPAQLIWIDDGVLLVRGTTEFKVGGPRAAEAVQVVMEATAGDGAHRDEIREQFAEPDRPAIDELIEGLLSRGFLIADGAHPPPADVESSLDVFYWHFGQTAATVAERLNQHRLVIVGVNCISRQLAAALTATGVTSAAVVDYPLLRNVRLFDDEDRLLAPHWPPDLPRPVEYEAWTASLETGPIECVIATSDFGGTSLLRQWNEFCVGNGYRFLPIVLDRMVGSVGPLIVPGQTACYECLRARENANLEAPDLRRAADAGAHERQLVTGFHPSMASILGDIAALELTKFYGGVLPWKVGMLLEVNLLAMRLASRKVLKLPRCPVCSPLRARSTSSVESITFMPGNAPAS